MVKALSFLALGAAWAMVNLWVHCLGGCTLDGGEVLSRWSSATAGVLVIAWFLHCRKGR